MHEGCGEDVSGVSRGGGEEEDGQGDSQRREEVNNAWRCLVDTHTFRPSAEGNCSSARRDVSPPFV